MSAEPTSRDDPASVVAARQLAEEARHRAAAPRPERELALRAARRARQAAADIPDAHAAALQGHA